MAEKRQSSITSFFKPAQATSSSSAAKVTESCHSAYVENGHPRRDSGDSIQSALKRKLDEDAVDTTTSFSGGLRSSSHSNSASISVASHHESGFSLRDSPPRSTATPPSSSSSSGVSRAASSQIDFSRLDVSHDEKLNRFSLGADSLETYLDYHAANNDRYAWIEIKTIHIPPELQGNNLSEKLVNAAFQYAKKNNVKVKAKTSYVWKTYLVQHPEFRPMYLAPAGRRRGGGGGGTDRGGSRGRGCGGRGGRDGARRPRDEVDSPAGFFGEAGDDGDFLLEMEMEMEMQEADAFVASREMYEAEMESTVVVESKPKDSDAPPATPPVVDAGSTTSVGRAVAEIPLPHHPAFAARWQLVAKLFAAPLSNLEGLSDAFRLLSPGCHGVVRGLQYFIESTLSADERAHFFSNTLPFIQQCVLSLPRVFASPTLALVSSQFQESHHLTAAQCAALLGSGFFCLLPENKKSARFHSANFRGIFETLSRDRPAQSAKMCCLLHYFDRRSKAMPDRTITFYRRVLSLSDDDIRKRLEISSSPLRAFAVKTTGCIEDDGKDMLQADFANRYIGGGVLGLGCVQEEIRFLINPECLVSLFFCEMMEDNEAIVIIGAERFSNYAGYADTFTFTTNFEDDTKLDEQGRIATAIVAIDAIRFGGGLLASRQFAADLVLREVMKAYTGFSVSSDELVHDYSGIATGNWGCGAFGGDVGLKSMVQWLAASLAERDITYFTYDLGDPEETQLCLLAQELPAKGVSVGELWAALGAFTSFCKAEDRKQTGALLEYLLNNHKWE